MLKKRNDIDKIIHPETLAIYGVSPKGGLGNLLMQGLIELKFPKIYPIHPRESEIIGTKAYPDLSSIDDDIDLIIVAVHPKNVKQIIKDAVEKKVKGAVLFSAGFREIGEDGKRLEDEVINIAKEGGLRIIGPNCMGIYCPESKLSFFPSLPPEKGNTAFISQSGSLSTLICLNSMLKGIQFSKIISIGNCADLGINDFLEYLGSDDDTEIIGFYLEGLKNGKEFIELAKEISKFKPIIMWKVGKTKAGAKAASSHTGSLCGDFKVWDDVMDQAGIIRVNNLDQLIEHFGMFQNPNLPRGKKVAIISGPGGPAVSCADACELAGLKLAELSDKTKQNILNIIPEFGTSIKNPIDLGLQVSFLPKLENNVVELVGLDKNVDMLMIYLSILKKDQLKGLLKIQDKIKKPIALVTAFEINISTKQVGFQNYFLPLKPKYVPKYLRKMYEKGISVHSNEQNAAKALHNLMKYSKFKKKWE
ncbi:MAG: acetyl-CoA synthetase [Candidatus Lokiarchaeota archaeon]|nr:acetyl-CoA synthetase [Candidatus Lokiarchaeota archaeon]